MVWLMFIVGLVLGASAGLLTAALLFAARDMDRIDEHEAALRGR